MPFCSRLSIVPYFCNQIKASVLIILKYFSRKAAFSIQVSIGTVEFDQCIHVI